MKKVLYTILDSMKQENKTRKLTSTLYLLTFTNTLIYNIAQWAYARVSDQYVIK